MRTLLLVIAVGIGALVLMTSCVAVIGTAMTQQTNAPVVETTEEPTKKRNVKPKVKIKAKPKVKYTAKPKVKTKNEKSRTCAKHWWC